jgi:hypothetical protein
MNNIPALCIDDFYSDPDSVRALALKQEYTTPLEGNYPGKRTKRLDELDRNFFNQFCSKLLSIFFDLDSESISYEIDTSFQLIPSVDPNPMSPKNMGWVHYDENVIFAGVIFLTPKIDLNCGTSIFKLVDKEKLDLSNAKKDFYKNGIDSDYDNLIQRHRDAYIETIRFNNVYNRLIAFDSSSAHGVNSYYSDSDPRLTQVFFVTKIDTNTKPPILRQKKYL